jgi:flagellar biosynthesis repressor protein FlbT
MTLRISLRDGEKIIVNGAVLRSKGRTNLSIESKAAILRGRDLIEAAEATSPATRLYHACISAYTDPENSGTHQDNIVTALTEVMATLQQPVAIAAATSFARFVAMSDYYRALADCRSLMTIERSAALPSTLRLVHSNDAHLLPA